MEPTNMTNDMLSAKQIDALSWKDQKYPYNWSNKSTKLLFMFDVICKIVEY